MDDLERFVDRVGFLDDGRLLVDEPLTALRERFRRDDATPMSLREIFVTLARTHRAQPGRTR
jgi:ABC-type multidrug transport system ATPase subunit